MKTGRKPLKKTIKKKIVKLASEGKTDKQILQVIPSISQMSVSRVKKSNRDIIEANKQKYIKLIDSRIGDAKQAEVLSGVINADTEIYNFKGEIVGTRPDYKTRLDAIKYIDKLKGREAPSVKLSQTNNYIAKGLDKYFR